MTYCRESRNPRRGRRAALGRILAGALVAGVGLSLSIAPVPAGAKSKRSGQGKKDAALAKRLRGSWRGVAQEVNGRRYPLTGGLSVTFRFAAKGRFVAIMRTPKATRRDGGHWAVRAGKLYVTSRRKNETKKFEVTVTEKKLSLLEGKTRFLMVRK